MLLHFLLQKFQFFIEKDSKSKQLAILTVEHVANSIRTHGMGIMNTAVSPFSFNKKTRFYYLKTGQVALFLKKWTLTALCSLLQQIPIYLGEI